MTGYVPLACLDACARVICVMRSKTGVRSRGYPTAILQGALILSVTKVRSGKSASDKGRITAVFPLWLSFRTLCTLRISEWVSKPE
ncbi:MAG: hypothetical protein A4E64_00219 [Syntrophorhabdus sp. PtaU1.Bin058]|nr:MAG: hypothetical protein A4E64_00219 [Syntrophorhabdus sp. PtaU1.Bin058]